MKKIIILLYIILGFIIAIYAIIQMGDLSFAYFHQSKDHWISEIMSFKIFIKASSAIFLIFYYWIPGALLTKKNYLSKKARIIILAIWLFIILLMPLKFQW